MERARARERESHLKRRRNEATSGDKADAIGVRARWPAAGGCVSAYFRTHAHKNLCGLGDASAYLRTHANMLLKMQ
jgi:hypothetical protein